MKPSFAPGDKVRVVARETATHCRTPHYQRGKRGVVSRVFGTFPNPEQLAYHRIGVPHVPLYQVDFDYAEVWGKAAPNTRISADIFQHWLEADR